MNLRIITKNLSADSKIRSSLKMDFRADWTHEFNPTAWKLTLNIGIVFFADRLRNKLTVSIIAKSLLCLLVNFFGKK